MPTPKKLPLSFYSTNDVVAISKALLGQTLCTNINGKLCKGIIVETEAYNGRTDEGCHAYPNKKTPRTETMYEAGGIAYVYICYGIHNMLNVVCNKNGLADCVLIRAIEPIEGIAHMLKRRKMKTPKPRLTMGPGSVCQAMGIAMQHNGAELNANAVWIEKQATISNKNIAVGPRVGMSKKDRPYAWYPWRFSVKENVFVSKWR